ncbi:type IV pilus biogenesis protein PilM [Pseudomonas viridiflava]|uniref:type IV pilus biogenesis protein PilM n=1 Tax=Pseudomonas viridiflava TaxID=33069 RepID=UPI000F042EF3|nr:type IV pilus biogenesis protein PilM [Pseudomonas viridiflava]
MPMLGFLLALFFVIAALSGTENLDQSRVSAKSESDAIAGNMLVYRNFVSLYAQNNPAANGSIADLSLGLPVWFNRSPYLNNYVALGKSYVYYTVVVPGLVWAVSDVTGSINVGTNEGGVLNTPGKGQTAILLPAQIPQSSVVIVQ